MFDETRKNNYTITKKDRRMNDGKRKYELFGMLCKWSGLQSDDENDSAEGFKEAEYHSRQASSLCPFGGKVSGSSVRCGTLRAEFSEYV